MIPQPKGLTIPECKCFQKHLKDMNKGVDYVAGRVSLYVLGAGEELGICEKARDYYIAAAVSHIMQLLLYAKPGDKRGSELDMSDYVKDMEAIYDRLKPLVMERLDYVDGYLDTMENK